MGHPLISLADDPSDYTPNPKGMSVAIDDIQSYLPSIDRSAISLDYVGIRPKLGESSALAGKQVRTP